MRAFLCPVAAILLTVSLAAQTTHKPKARPKAAAVTAEDVKALRDALAEQSSALAAQQQQIQDLKQSLERDQAWQQAQQQLEQARATASDAQSKATAIESVANDEKASVAKLSTDVADVRLNLTKSLTSGQEEQKRVSALEGMLGRFRFGGDIRLRDDSIFQACATCLDRNRARLRVRFGLDGKLGEDFTGGFYLATGSLGDSNSTNETLTNFFDRKTIGLDRGYITYQPGAHKWLQLTGGKFAYTWQRTSVTFDPDINPEGFNEGFAKNCSSINSSIYAAVPARFFRVFCVSADLLAPNFLVLLLPGFVSTPRRSSRVPSRASKIFSKAIRFNSGSFTGATACSACFTKFS